MHKTMTEPRSHRRPVRNRKRNAIPLYKLRTSDVVRTVVDHPRRLEELLKMLEDTDRDIRSKAAATVARLSEAHPARLLRATFRLKEALSDESAYVRWYMIYALGELGTHYPAHARLFLNEVVARLDDDNRVVRIFTCKALRQVATRNPAVIEELFQNLKKDIPTSVARVLRGSKRVVNKPRR